MPVPTLDAGSQALKLLRFQRGSLLLQGMWHVGHALWVFSEAGCDPGAYGFRHTRIDQHPWGFPANIFPFGWVPRPGVGGRIRFPDSVEEAPGASGCIRADGWTTTFLNRIRFAL